MVQYNTYRGGRKEVESLTSCRWEDAEAEEVEQEDGKEKEVDEEKEAEEQRSYLFCLTLFELLIFENCQEFISQFTAV